MSGSSAWVCDHGATATGSRSDSRAGPRPAPAGALRRLNAPAPGLAVAPGWRTPLVVIVAGCLIATIGFGARSSLGLFLEPLTAARGFSRETFGLALAIQNLFWGLGLPVAGALADRHGAARVIVAGAVVYALGLWGMAWTASGTGLHLFAGALAGLGIAFSAFSLALAAMVRVVGPERRTFVLGLGTAAGSAGQVLFSPLALGLIEGLGWERALHGLALAVLAMIPLALLLPRSPSGELAAVAGAASSPAEQSLSEALAEALGHRGFVLLTTGFFVCGFHVAFITVHFPAYVADLGLPASVGAASLALIGLANIVGSFAAGWAGQRFSKRHGLAAIYALRAVAILALLSAPKTAATVYAFATVMGLLWLSTVPLTTGLIAQVFGVRFMATLFGLVFLSHQIGSFLGVWLGGVLYDRTGSYDGMWWAGVALGIVAALVHLPIDERPLAREASPAAG